MYFEGTYGPACVRVLATGTLLTHSKGNQPHMHVCTLVQYITASSQHIKQEQGFRALPHIVLRRHDLNN